jgi:hypothetical protein
LLDQEREAVDGMAEVVGLFARLRQLGQLLQAALGAARVRPGPLSSGFQAMLKRFALLIGLVCLHLNSSLRRVSADLLPQQLHPLWELCLSDFAAHAFVPSFVCRSYTLAPADRLLQGPENVAAAASILSHLLAGSGSGGEAHAQLFLQLAEQTADVVLRTSLPPLLSSTALKASGAFVPFLSH